MPISFREILPRLNGWMLAALLLAPLPALAAPATAASPFTSAKIDDMSGEVTITPSSDPTTKQPAKLDEIFSAPDTLETGRRSHAELKADDGTIARVGSNTAFSLEANSRTIHLQQGSILFNSPKGMGGGTIVTNSATATVLGTTIIVAATSNGGFKILVLEGHASVTFPGGQVVNLGPGQMTFVLPGSTGGGSSSGGSTGGGSSSGGSSGTGDNSGGTPGPVLNFDLSRETTGSGLLNGFSVILPSSTLIVDATHTQQLQISNGELTQTNQAVIGAVNGTQVLLVDQSTLTAATETNPSNQGNSGDDLSRALRSVFTYTPGSRFPSLNVFFRTVIFNASDLGIPNGVIENNMLKVSGVIAGDIGLGGNVDLNQLDSLNSPDLLAANTHTFTFTGNTVLGGLSHATRLGLYSAGSFVIPAGISITTDYVPADYTSGSEDPVTDYEDYQELKLELGSVGAMSLNQNTISNPSGNLSVSTLLGDLTMNASTLVSGLDYDDEDGESDVEAKSSRGNVVIAGNSTIQADNYGQIFITAGGNLSIQNSTVLLGLNTTDSHYGNINVAAVGGLNVTGSSLLGENLSLMGGATAVLNGTTLPCSTSEVQIGAATVVIGNVNFSDSGSVDLWSATGQLNMVTGNTSPVTGDINFVGNVTYGGADASDYIGDGINLGITADNAGVQSALGQSFTLPATTVTVLGGKSPSAAIATAPDDLLFDQVMFTPANLAAYVPDTTHDPFIFPGGLIVGNLVINGDSEGEATSVLVENLTFTSSGNLELYDGSELDFYLLGGISAPANGTLTFDFPDACSSSTLSIDSFPSLKLSHLTIHAPGSEVDLTGEEDNDPSIALESTTLDAGYAIYLNTYGDGGIAVANSTLISGNGSEIGFSTHNSQSGISVSGSNLSASEGLYLDAGSKSYDSDGSISVTSSTLSSGNGSLDLNGAPVFVSNSSLNSYDGLSIYSSADVTIQASDLYSGYSSYDSIEITGATVSVADSELETTGNISLYSEGDGGISVANSSLNGAGSLDVEADSFGAPITFQASNLTSNGDIYISTDVSTDNGTLGDVAIQSSTLTSNSSSIEIDGGSSVAVAGNSTLAAQGNVTLSGDAVAVQDSTLQSGRNGNGTCGYVEIAGGHVVTVVNSTIVAQNVDLHAADVSGSTLTVNKLNVDAATAISMAARTISLSNVNFPSGSSVSLASQNGLLAPNPNTNAVPIVGYVNYVTNVLYNGQPAQNFTYVSGSPGSSGSSTSPTAPIQISTGSVR